MARALDHDLAVVLPGLLGQLPERLELGELRRVVGVGDRARAQAVAQAEGDVVGPHDLADLVEVRVEEVLLMVRQAPLGHDRAAAADDAGDALGGQRDVAQQHAGVDREVVHALLGLLDRACRGRSPRSAPRPCPPPSPAPGRSAPCRWAPASCAGSTRASRGCCGPVERSITVSAPQRVAQCIFSTSSSIEDGHGRVADVGVDLDQEVAADDHRLGSRGD